MKIYAISDTHVQHEHVTKPTDADILFHCGDFTDRGSPEDHNSFMEWYGSIPAKERYVLPGNHDIHYCFLNWGYESEHLGKEVRHPLNYGLVQDPYGKVWHSGESHYVTPESVGVKVLPPAGITETDTHVIVSIAYSPYINKWWGFYTQTEYDAKLMMEDLADEFNKIDLKGRKVIVVSHGPMRNILDRTHRGQNVGCVWQNAHFMVLGGFAKNTTYICGHIHEDAGEVFFDPRGSTKGLKVYNVAYCDARNNPRMDRGFVDISD